MGIRLDWEVENERSKTRTLGEDPDVRKRRARALRRTIMVLLLLILIGAGIVAVVTWRLGEVDAQIRESLVITVENEVAALRIGDRNTYTSIQRSDSALWLQMQQDLYDAYQQLKTDANVVLSGRVIDAVVDGARGRVQVEEIVDGIPYARTWFYFRYDDGWRHVPPDTTFWGDARTAQTDGVTLTYFGVDQPLADAVSSTLPRWLADGCAILACAQPPPPLTVEIVPDETLSLGWSSSDPNRLIMPSPFTGAARLDSIFTPEAQLRAASLLAERLVNIVQPAQPLPDADAAYLRQAVISWLVERFTGQATNAFSIESFAQTYGEAAVGRLLAALTPDASMRVLATVAGVDSLGDMTLDWRDLLTWRLALENTLIAEQDDAVFLTLYDTNDPTAQQVAISRYAAGSLGETSIVTEAVREIDAMGIPILRATTLVRSGSGDRTETVVFRLIDGDWKRAS
jgi:hypothetical protein